ncbi:MAG: glycosyltransferase family 4 protein [Alphaproteobacteria bacterium]
MLPHYFEPQTKSGVTSKPNIQANPKVTVGAAGRFVEKKGFKTFIDAAAKIKSEYPETEFLLAGDGSLFTQLRSHAEQSGDPVRFTGWVDIENFAPSIDIFCIPSLNEPFGYILAEMMHHGVAIIATRTNGPLWICEGDENALFFQPSDSNELAHCLRTLITDPQKRLRYQHNAIKAINDKRFSKQVFAEHLFSIISIIIKNMCVNKLSEIGSAVEYLISSIAKEELTSFNGTSDINFL